MAPRLAAWLLLLVVLIARRSAYARPPHSHPSFGSHGSASVRVTASALTLRGGGGGSGGDGGDDGDDEATAKWNKELERVDRAIHELVSLLEVRPLPSRNIPPFVSRAKKPIIASTERASSRKHARADGGAADSGAEGRACACRSFARARAIDGTRARVAPARPRPPLFDRSLRSLGSVASLDHSTAPHARDGGGWGGRVRRRSVPARFAARGGGGRSRSLARSLARSRSRSFALARSLSLALARSRSRSLAIARLLDEDDPEDARANQALGRALLFKSELVGRDPRPPTRAASTSPRLLEQAYQERGVAT